MPRVCSTQTQDASALCLKTVQKAPRTKAETVQPQVHGHVVYHHVVHPSPPRVCREDAFLPAPRHAATFHRLHRHGVFVCLSFRSASYLLPSHEVGPENCRHRQRSRDSLLLPWPCHRRARPEVLVNARTFSTFPVSNAQVRPFRERVPRQNAMPHARCTSAR